MSSPADVVAFLENYPEQHEDNVELNENLKFYSNKICARPDGLLINEIHEQWEGDYETLEHRHGFIQWLFPIQEYGMNYESQPLQRHEIKTIRESPEITQRLLASYRLMLDFYGMRLTDPASGLLDRVLPPKDTHARFHNLVRSSHNYLRITRILKCLSELGLERLNAGFLLFVLKEQSENNELDTPRIRHSMDHWWADCIRDGSERSFVRQQIDSVRKEKVVWTLQKYKHALSTRLEKGCFQDSGTTY